MTKTIQQNKEPEKSVPTAWIFDVDGVLSDPIEKKPTQPQLLIKLADILKQNRIIALNTGRSLEWVKNRILTYLEQNITEKAFLSNLFIVGEKGASWMEYVNGNWQTGLDISLSLPASLKKQIKDIVAQNTSKSAFYDEGKKVMATIEMKDNYSTEKFAKDQALLLPKVQTALNEFEGEFTLDYSIIDIDIQHKNSGKSLGARRILEWLKRKGIKPQTFITFGDNRSDFEMAEELQKDGYSVQFVFVGKDKTLAENKNYPVFISKEPFEKGTLEFLNSSN